jgi:predicted RNase H-like nuclease
VRSVGVDGCRAGWIAVTRTRGRLVWGVYPRMADVVAAHPRAERIFVDMPIGLPRAGAPIRECDRFARALLGPRRSSVFPVPCRAAAHASDPAEARRHNLAILGRSLAEQTLRIRHKIAEIDDLLRDDPGLPLREIHPEVCFQALAGRPLAHNKKTRAGAEERLAVLAPYAPDARALVDAFALPRRAAAPDDLIDALAALVTASARAHACLPAAPPRDERGLPMESVLPAAR